FSGYSSNTFCQNCFCSSLLGCTLGLTSLNPIKLESVFHQKLFGIWGSLFCNFKLEAALAEERNTPASSSQEPPRATLGWITVGLIQGFLDSEMAYAFSLYSSIVHSATLPCISYNPQGLGSLLPTLAY